MQLINILDNFCPVVGNVKSIWGSYLPWYVLRDIEYTDRCEVVSSPLQRTTLVVEKNQIHRFVLVWSAQSAAY